MMNANYMRLVSSMNKTSTAYLVDDYSPDVAYSTQKISSSITNVIRVRRTSDSAESDFTATDLADGTMLTWVGTTGSDNGHVAKWYNQGTGGSTYDVAQTVASAQPFIVTAGVAITRNSIPTLRFVSNDILKVTSTPLGSTDVSYFSVSDSNVTATVGIVFCSHSTTQGLRVTQDSRTTPYRNLVVTNTGATTYLADMSTARTTINTLRLLCSFVDSSKNMSSFDNSATGGTDTYTGTTNSTGIYLGVQGTSNYLNGTISEFMGFATDKSADRTDIETNINDRFSIY